MAASSSSPPLIVDNVPTGLTEEHIKSLQIFWRKVRPNVDEHGLQIFALFFEDYPHYLKYFDFSAGEQAGAGADSNLVDNRMLQAHSIFVLSSLGNLIQYALKDDLLLTCSLTRVHKKHIGRNIKQKDVMVSKILIIVELLYIINIFENYLDFCWISS